MEILNWTPELAIPETCAVRGMPENLYHAHPAIGSSDFREFVKSPSTWAAKRAGAITEDDEKKELLIGSAIHALSMGFTFNLDNRDTFSEMTAKKTLTAAAVKNRLLVENAVRCLKHDETFQNLCTWEKELSLFGILPSGLKVKARPDFFLDARPTEIKVYDLKTSKDSSPYEFNKSVAEYGYHIQKIWYMTLIQLVYGEPQTFPSEVEGKIETESRHFRFFVIGKQDFQMHDYGLTPEYDNLASDVIAGNAEKMAEAIKFDSYKAMTAELSPPKYL